MGLNRRDFLKLSLVTLVSACTRLTGINVYPTSTVLPSPRTTAKISSPTPTASATPDCPPIHRVYQTPGVNAGNFKPAETRDLSDIKFVTIHHNEEVPANDYCALKVKATDLDWYHSSRDYDQDNVSDARYTMGEFGYKWVLYHFLVGRDGDVLQLQDPKYVRFHASDSCSGAESHNLHGIAICLDGNFDVTAPSHAQLFSSAQIIKNWQKTYNTKLGIQGHRERIEQSQCGAPYKSCPGAEMGSSTDKNSLLGQLIEMANS